MEELYALLDDGEHSGVDFNIRCRVALMSDTGQTSIYIYA